MKRRCRNGEQRLRQRHDQKNERRFHPKRYSTFGRVARSRLNCLQEGDGLGVMPTPMEVDPTLGDPGIYMPGTYIEEPSLNQLLNGTTDATATPMEPAVQPRRIQQPPARFRDVLPEPPQPVPASVLQPRLPTIYLMVTDPLKTALNSFGLFRRYLFHHHMIPTHLSIPAISQTSLPARPPLPLQDQMRKNTTPPGHLRICRSGG